ncbi:MAG: serine hydrolase [Patescibacteria group bacterium]
MDNLKLIGIAAGISFLIWQVPQSIGGPKNTGFVKGVRAAKLELPALQLPPKVKNDSEPRIGARYFALYDPESGYLVAGNEAETPVPIASLTKLMTGILVSEHYDLSKEIEVSRSAVSVIGSDAKLRLGEKLTIESLLKALLIVSANDAGYVLAEQYEGGLAGFINAMNDRATTIGLHKTQFKDPVGLDDTGRSTAKELAVLSAYFLKNPELAKIVKTPKTTISSTDGRLVHELESSNRLITEDLYYPGILGIKTGFTPDAGHSITVAAERNGHTLVAVVLNTYQNTKDASAKEAAKLLDWGFGNLDWE